MRNSLSWTALFLSASSFLLLPEPAEAGVVTFVAHKVSLSARLRDGTGIYRLPANTEIDVGYPAGEYVPLTLTSEDGKQTTTISFAATYLNRTDCAKGLCSDWVKIQYKGAERFQNTGFTQSFKFDGHDLKNHDLGIDKYELGLHAGNAIDWVVDGEWEPNNKTITFFSTGDHIDPFDSFSLNYSYREAAPEPGPWALCLLGFGLLGAQLRRRGRALTLSHRVR